MRTILSGLVCVVGLAGCAQSSGGRSARDVVADVGAADAETEPPELCGNTMLDPTEVCDGDLLQGQSCEGLGFGSGVLGCAPDCSDYDRSACGAAESCGNGVVDENDVCDGADVGAQTCVTLGFGPGTLGCLPNCAEFDTSGCGAKVSCGDGVVAGSEVCDGTNLGGESCVSQGLSGGTLACATDCQSFVLTGCETPSTCGNGQLDPGEQCDGGLLDGKSCGDFGHWGGELSCADGCLAFDESACVTECQPDCSAVECGPDPVCGTECGGCDEFSACSAGQCVQICDLPVIDEDMVVDLNLVTAAVSVTVTLNGQPMPSNGLDAEEQRGWVEITNRDTFESWFFNVGATGPATASVELFAGTYDIEFHANGGGAQDVLPSQDVVLEKGVVVDGATVLQYDLTTATLDATVMLDGGPVPNNTLEGEEDQSRGTLRIVRKDTGHITYANLGSTGSATVNRTLLTGDYFVQLSPSGIYDQNVWPTQDIVVEPSLALETDITTQLPVKTVTVTGNVTVNGGTMVDNSKPDSEEDERGWIVFRRNDTAEVVVRSLEASGAAQFSVTMFAGDYDVLLDSGGWGQNAIPNQDAVLAEDVTFTTDQVANYDLGVVDITGVVTLNGAPMPNNTEPGSEDDTRGWLGFLETKTGKTRWVNLGPSGEAGYAVTVIASDYHVLFDANSPNSQDVLPYQEIRVLGDQSLTSSQNLNLNLQTAEISGQITVDGAVMADNTEDGPGTTTSRAYLRFRRHDTGSDRTYSLGASGPAVFATEVFVGNYTVELSPSSFSSQDVMPSTDVRLEPLLAIDGSDVFDWNLDIVTVTGEVTVNGAPMANNTQDGSEESSRGYVDFVSSNTGQGVLLSIGASGAATFEVELWGGSYDVRWSSGYSQNVVPRREAVLAVGCLEAGDCNASSEDVTGQWYVSTANGFWDDFTFSLVQTNGVLTGTFTSSGGDAGTIGPNPISGTSFSFTTDWTVCDVVEGTATLAGGCLMSGTMVCSLGGETTFTAFRLGD